MQLLYIFTISILHCNADQYCALPKGAGPCFIDQSTPWIPPPSPSPTGNFICDSSIPSVDNIINCEIDCDASDLSTYGACSGWAIPVGYVVYTDVEIHCKNTGGVACQTCTVNCLSDHACSGTTIYNTECSLLVVNLNNTQVGVKINPGPYSMIVNTLSNAQISQSNIFDDSTNTQYITVNCVEGIQCGISVRGDSVQNTLHYICDGDQDCSSVDIWCPNDNNGPTTGECIIDCLSTNDNGCSYMDVYAVEGIYDADWTCMTYGLSGPQPSYSSNNCLGAKLTCGENLDITAQWTHVGGPPPEKLCCYWGLSNECDNSPSPTSSPTGITGTPTSTPSAAPTAAPSQAPSFNPSMAPTSPPTASPFSVCTDFKENSNDGNNETRFDHDVILNLDNYYGVFTEFTSGGSTIDCTGSDCKVQCVDKALCLDTIFDVTNVGNESIVIYCEGSYSCATSSVIFDSVVSSENIRPNISVICVDKHACNDMDISVHAFTSFNLYCIGSLSCNHVNITIDVDSGYYRENDGIISCVNPNSCDELYIVSTSNQTQLIMYEYSQDVTLNNGVGYLYDDQNIICNNDRYIRIETSQTITTQNITDLIYQEYNDDLLPCQGVEVLCGDDSCSMQYFQKTLTGITPNTGCVWLNVQEIQNIVCEGSCVGSPTSPPTSTPTYVPTGTTTEPTTTPSVAPSNAPSQTPTAPPTTSPSVSPSNNPSVSPISKPTRNPTIPPSSAPTFPPTQSPTRVPTNDIDDIYGSLIDIVYMIENLNENYIELLEDETLTIVPYVVEIIESNYFVGTNVVEYKDFMVQIKSINGFKDLTNINLKSGQDVTFNSQILADSYVAGTLLKTSQSSDFANAVTADLKAYFLNNTALEFYVENKDSLNIQTGEDSQEESSWTIIIISGSIVGAGGLCSIFVKVLNKRKNSKFDNANWKAPLLFALQIYDLISDINLSFDILSNDAAYQGDSKANIILWCGVFSAVFTAVPFVSNLIYGVGIKKQKVITQNKRADEYFTANMAIFIAFVVLSGGCFPALIMVSSGIFALNAFQSGLTKHELNKLSKIKIKSTITLENGPQLIVQIIYATQTTEISTAVFLAFVGSFLSVIMAVSSYMANRQNRKDSDIMSYMLRFYKDSKESMNKGEKENIDRKKGRKEALTKGIANSLGVSKDNLEIGYVWTLNNGLEMQISHYLPKSELAKHTTNVNGFISEITPKQYLYLKYNNNKFKESINDKFRNHFEIDDKQFIVELVMDNYDTSQQLTPVTPSEFVEGDNQSGKMNRNYNAISTNAPSQIVEMHNMMQAMMNHMNINATVHNDDKLQIVEQEDAEHSAMSNRSTRI